MTEQAEPFKHPDFEPSPRELRIQKHIARLQSAEEMFAEEQISKPELDNIRARMLQVIEDPNA